MGNYEHRKPSKWQEAHPDRVRFSQFIKDFNTLSARGDTGCVGFYDFSRCRTGDHQIVASRALGARELVGKEIVTFCRAATIWAANRLNGFHVIKPLLSD